MPETPTETPEQIKKHRDQLKLELDDLNPKFANMRQVCRELQDQLAQAHALVAAEASKLEVAKTALAASEANTAKSVALVEQTRAAVVKLKEDLKKSETGRLTAIANQQRADVLLLQIHGITMDEVNRRTRLLVPPPDAASESSPAEGV